MGSQEMVNLVNSTIFGYIRYVGSISLFLFSTVVTFYAILEQKTSFWKAVPGWASLLIFLLVLFLIGVMEGIQIALVELKLQDPATYKASHPKAYRLGQMAARGDNIERFLMGRQGFVLCGKADDNPREITRRLSLPSSRSCSDFALGDWTVGLRRCGHCGAADPPDYCQRLPSGVHANNGWVARLLRLHLPRGNRDHPLHLYHLSRFINNIQHNIITGNRDHPLHLDPGRPLLQGLRAG